MSLPGCRSIKDVESLPFVEDRYEFETVLNVDSPTQNEDYDLLQDIRIDHGTILDVSDFFRLKTTKTLVSNALDIPITGHFSGTPGKIAQDIARAYNLSFLEVENTYYLIKDAPIPPTVCATITCDLSIEDLQQLSSDLVFIRRDNKVILQGDFFKVRDVVNYLSAINNVIEQNYCITVVEVETSLEQSLDLQLEIQSKGIDLISAQTTLYDVFSAYASAQGIKLSSDNYHERQLVATSGQLTTYNRTIEKKLEKRAISDAGTSTVEGYETLEAGILLDVTVNSYNEDYCNFAYSLELSNFVGITSDKATVNVKSDKVLVRPGKIYYLAAAEDRTKEKSFNILGLGHNNIDMVSSIFVKIDKISK